MPLNREPIEYPVETLADALDHGHRIWGFCAACGWARAFHPREIMAKHGRYSRLRDIQRGGTCPVCGWVGARGGLYLVPTPIATLGVIPADKRWWSDKVNYGPNAITMRTLGDFSPSNSMHWNCKNDHCRAHGELDVVGLARANGPDMTIEAAEAPQRCPFCAAAGRRDDNIAWILGHDGNVREKRNIREILADEQLKRS